MNIWPLRFRNLAENRLIVADDSGTFFRTDGAFIGRYANDELSSKDIAFLKRNGHTFESSIDPDYMSFAWRWSARHASKADINYVIVVPTLRCNLACEYCQVSRASESASGYDWSDETLASVLVFLDSLQSKSLKVEFQGGEPLLRLDILKAVTDFCRSRFRDAEFAVCTNLQHELDQEKMGFLQSPDVFVSTSLDGPLGIHRRQRTNSQQLTDQFYQNLKQVFEAVGPDRLSALPTVDARSPPDFEELVSAYDAIGQSSIFFRPINFQGFARRRAETASRISEWNSLYNSFVRFLIERNYRLGRGTEEYYLTYCLKRILQVGRENFVDLRNPNLPASGYLVIDFDGRIYPSDEARMLARIGYFDLSIGHVEEGLDSRKLAPLEDSAFNDFDPDCVHCPYQPFCGVDYVDDVSRYGRIDVPRHQTWFCRRQTAMFDLAFELLYSDDEAVKFSMAQWLGISTVSSFLTPNHYDTAAN